MQRCLLKNTNHNPDPSAYNSLGQKRTAKRHDDGNETVHFLSRVSPEAHRYDANGAGKGTIPPVHHNNLISQSPAKTDRFSAKKGGFLIWPLADYLPKIYRGRADPPAINAIFHWKQKFKKFRADKALVLCYTIKTDVISILVYQGGVFL